MSRPLKRTTDLSPYWADVKIPTRINTILTEKMVIYNIRSYSEIIAYLAESYLNKSTHVPISDAIKEIFKYVCSKSDSKMISEPSVGKRFCMPGNQLVELSRLAETTGFKTRSNLVSTLIIAFCLAPNQSCRQLSEELGERALKSITKDSTIYLSTCVNRYQYQILKQKADNINTSISKLIKTVINVLFSIEIYHVSQNLPEDMEERIIETMKMSGSTVKRFKREIEIHIQISKPDERDGIFKLMQKYRIPGYNEFIRRIILFLLDSDRYTENESEEADYISNLFDDSDNYRFDKLSQREFSLDVFFMR